ncbi:MAG TPA: hypothetical protein VI197_02800 [Polyangiaceae bacterium]
MPSSDAALTVSGYSKSALGPLDMLLLPGDYSADITYQGSLVERLSFTIDTGTTTDLGVIDVETIEAGRFTANLSWDGEDPYTPGQEGVSLVFLDGSSFPSFYGDGSSPVVPLTEGEHDYAVYWAIARCARRGKTRHFASLRAHCITARSFAL